MSTVEEFLAGEGGQYSRIWCGGSAVRTEPRQLTRLNLGACSPFPAAEARRHFAPRLTDRLPITYQLVLCPADNFAKSFEFGKD
jgi:hypothetical protein